jgi:hypothetical protein
MAWMEKYADREPGNLNMSCALRLKKPLSNTKCKIVTLSLLTHDKSDRGDFYAAIG